MSQDDDDLLRHTETWSQADVLLSRPARLEEALALKAHLDGEDRAAERLIAPLLTSQIRFRDAKLAENPKARHPGVVRCLCAAAHGLHEKRPQFSLLLARTAYRIAVTLEELGLATERARVGWSLALILVRRGELVPGAEKLVAARTELRNLGLLNDHGLATLDWAAARLALGTPADVADACKSIMMRFESQDMMRNARLALAYANEALARGTATPTFIRHIRTYLELLPTRPNETFVPLQ